MKKTLVMTLLLLVTFAATALAANYRFVEPAQFKQWLETGKKVQIVDIQVPAEFQKQHFRGSLETNAYPVKSEEDKLKLDKVVPVLAASAEDIVVICPRGGGGAKNTYDYLKEKGVAIDRLYILADGMQGWPYKELTVQAQK